MRAPEARARFAGCLLGGAVGDALGAPVEFQSLAEIRERFGPDGIRDFAPAYGKIGAITDDTQMALFTAEGLLRAHNRWLGKGIVSIGSVLRHAYLRWLHTQGEAIEYNAFADRGDPWPDGWLAGLPELHERRAPEPLNDSKGCGAVMRIAPVGLALPLEPFEVGMEVAAVTHGHPAGYLAAGFLAAAIRELVMGANLEDAIAAAEEALRARDGHEAVLEAVHAARTLAGDGAPTPENVESLGQGWVAEECLGIGLYCALVAGSFEEGVVLAVNHGGDSDSTGAVAGNVLGTLHGRAAIPARWLDRLELRAAIEDLAEDMASHFLDDGFETTQGDWERYPGW